MKKKISFVATLALALSMLLSSMASLGPVKAQDSEVRAAWISTVFNIDWPSKASYGNSEKQKQEYISLLDRLKNVGINTVMIQVRPESDAFYKSNISPWSRFLTGKQGNDPGYDPLQFILEESHKRGMKVHAWLNPYRASIYDDISSTSPSNPINTHRDWVIKYQGKWYYDPGKPEVTKYISDVVAEIVENYQVDGIHFDDYFYPGPGFPDSNTFNQYGSGSIDNWRRANINNMVKTVRDRIKSINSNVVFGISPAGIWRNYSNDSNGSRTSGGESYNKQYADTRYWIKNGLVDYVVPQVYWRIGHPKADYATLVKWWSDQVRGTGVELYIGQGIYKHGQDEYNGENVAAEIKSQINLNRKYKDIKGSVFFSAKDIVNIGQVANDLKSLYTTTNPTDQQPDPNRRYPYQNKLWGANRAETAIKISQQGWKNGSSTVVLVNGKDLIAGVVSSPLAASYNAPILLSYPNKLSDNTIKEIKRLGARKVILVGTNNFAINRDLKSIKGELSNVTIEKIYSSDIEVASRQIADKLAQDKQVDTVYIASKEALVDVLSIASKAGKNRNPIIVSSNKSINQDSINWIKNKQVKNIYFIGGPDVLSDSVINQLGSALNMNLSSNRIYGNDRIQTNTKVIEKFYTKFSPKVFITRSNAPIDAITVSAFAQKSDSPIVLASSSVSQYQRDVLYPRSTSLLYQIGGGINANSYKEIYNLLEGVMQ